jgi:hypothetical protein
MELSLPSREDSQVLLMIAAVPDQVQFLLLLDILF